mmetsp:Transcript_29118/g.52094  ORF Transcript_29118/g.52094 Transcript_29118/m.52094 type:complete len:178 (+) Transcript_29118:2292-2825(+)
MSKAQFVEPSSFSRKIVVFYSFIALDIGFNYFSYYIEIKEPEDSTSSDEYDYGQGQILGFAIIAIQAILQILVCCWIFLLIWQTFLFRYGLIGLLCREFKMLFIMMPLNFVLFGAEKAYRLLLLMGDEDAISIWNAPGYQIIYWVRNLFMLAYYLMMIEHSLLLGEPQYYKPQKWLN